MAQPESPSKIEMKFINITSSILKYGVLISIALIIFGLIMLFIHGGSVGLHIPLNKILDPSSQVNTSRVTILYVLDGTERLGGLSLMLLGLLVLLAIPVIMVLINLVRFALERDVLYTVLALITLANLMIAMFVLPLLVFR
jgi:Predicted membrane protein